MARPKRKRVDQSGRRLGPRALQTRRRLLEATTALLGAKSVRDIKVVDIAKKVGTSPATFYQYFKDVEAAALCLAEEAVEGMPAVVELIDRTWRGQKGLDNAREIVDRFVHHWDDHRAVLLLRNLAADEGDRRFQKVRREALTPVLDHLARQIEESQKAGRIAPELSPYAAAAALASILERLAAYHKELEYFGVTRQQIRWRAPG